jgi:hypothetical protein
MRRQNKEAAKAKTAEAKAAHEAREEEKKKNEEEEEEEEEETTGMEKEAGAPR